ncbi:MAG: hypothetical protein H0U90_06325 [Actinobacteria bacterium]|nr:hypothetical protein [Actinomycetota bacterium]
MSDAVTLTIPHARSYYGVVHLVVGGLAARLDLSYDALDDVQVALDALLETDAYAGGPDVTVEIGLADGGLDLTVGPLEPGALARGLGRDSEESGVGLARLLETLTTGFEVERRDGGDWVRMRKSVPGVSGSGG